MEEESWAAGLGWEKLILVTPQHLDIYTLDISTHLQAVVYHLCDLILHVS